MVLRIAEMREGDNNLHIKVIQSNRRLGLKTGKLLAVEHGYDTNNLWGLGQAAELFFQLLFSHCFPSHTELYEPLQTWYNGLGEAMVKVTVQNELYIMLLWDYHAVETTYKCPWNFSVWSQSDQSAVCRELCPPFPVRWGQDRLVSARF